MGYFTMFHAIDSKPVCLSRRLPRNIRSFMAFVRRLHANCNPALDIVQGGLSERERQLIAAYRKLKS
jgi:hypothetical protein